MILKYLWENKTGKVIFVVFISSILLFLLLNLVISLAVNNIVKPKQLAKINSSPNIKLDIQDISYSLFSNSFTLDKITFTHSAGPKKNRDSLRININSINTKIDFLHLLFGEGYKFSYININHPLIQRTNSPALTDEAAEKKPEDNVFSFLDSLSKQLHFFSSGTIEINQGTYLNKNKSNGLSDSVINFNIKLKDVLFDSSFSKNLKLKAFEDIDLKVERARLNFSGIKYKLSFSDLNLNSYDNDLSLTNVVFGPYLTDEDFFNTQQYRSDRFILNIKKLNFNELDFRSIIHEQEIASDNLTIENFMLDALTNMRLPEDPNAPPPKMPNEVINEIPFKLNIKKAELTSGNIYVKEIYPYDDQPGVLLFSNFYSTISNIKNKEMVNFKIKTDLTGSGDLEFSLNLSLAPGLLKFDYSGKLGSMSAVDLNKFIVVADRVKVNSGNIEQVEFSVTARGDTARAQATPIYSELSINELDDETGSSKGLIEKFNSFIANTFIIKKSNPGEGEDIQRSSVIYVRKKDNAFMEYIWIALRGAVGDVVGFK